MPYITGLWDIIEVQCCQMQQHVAYKTKIIALQVQLNFLGQDSVEIVEFLKIIPWPNSFQ